MHRVMICEDDPLLAADLAAIVAESGHVVCGQFRRASDALASARKLKPSVAIIDLCLADGHTGAALAHELQANDVRVIVLSGYSNVGSELGRTPHTFAQKPVTRGLVEHLLSLGNIGPGDAVPA